MSDTPRTDHAWRMSIDNPPSVFAMASVARDLERELNAARARIAELGLEAATINDMVCGDDGPRGHEETTRALRKILNRIAELEAAPTPLPRPDKPGWWWCWEPDRKMWRIGWAKMEWPADNEDAKEKELVWWSPACGYDADKINRTILIGSQWLPATPPPAPKNEEGQG